MKILQEQEQKGKALKESTVDPIIDNVLDLADMMDESEVRDVIEEIVGVHYDGELEGILGDLEPSDLRAIYRKLNAKYGSAASGNEEMSEKEIEDILYEALSEHEVVDGVRTFEEVGLMTKNYGVVASIKGKDYQFQINGSWRD